MRTSRLGVRGTLTWGIPGTSNRARRQRTRSRTLEFLYQGQMGHLSGARGSSAALKLFLFISGAAGANNMGCSLLTGSLPT